MKISTSARRLAFVSFFVMLVLHQFTIPVAEAAPSWLKPFLASSWVHPVSGNVSILLSIESVLGSAIVGMFGLLIFGLIHPAWKPEMTLAFTKSAKNGISLVAASACVGIIIGIVQQTGIATDFSAAIKSVVETNLFLALIGITGCSLILGMGVDSTTLSPMNANRTLLPDGYVLTLYRMPFLLFSGMSRSPISPSTRYSAVPRP